MASERKQQCTLREALLENAHTWSTDQLDELDVHSNVIRVVVNIQDKVLKYEGFCPRRGFSYCVVKPTTYNSWEEMESDHPELFELNGMSIN